MRREIESIRPALCFQARKSCACGDAGVDKRGPSRSLDCNSLTSHDTTQKPHDHSERHKKPLGRSRLSGATASLRIRQFSGD